MPTSSIIAAASAAYKVPRQIVFLEALPKSTVGKILRRELRDLAEERTCRHPGYSTRTLKDFVGHDFGASAPIKVDQVASTPSPTSPATTSGPSTWRGPSSSPFGGPVAHGFLTLSLMAAAVASAGVVPADAQGVINCSLDKIRFIAPVPAGAMITATSSSPASRTRATSGG